MKLADDFLIHPRKAAPRYYSQGKTLDDVYGSYSEAKADAYEYCKRLCEKYNGHDFAIYSYCRDFFSVIFDFEHPETGECMRAIITKYHNHAYYL